jgi:hypothetical protein
MAEQACATGSAIDCAATTAMAISSGVRLSGQAAGWATTPGIAQNVDDAVAQQQAARTGAFHHFAQNVELTSSVAGAISGCAQLFTGGALIDAASMCGQGIQGVAASRAQIARERAAISAVDGVPVRTTPNDTGGTSDAIVQADAPVVPAADTQAPVVAQQPDVVLPPADGITAPDAPPVVNSGTVPDVPSLQTVERQQPRVSDLTVLEQHTQQELTTAQFARAEGTFGPELRAAQQLLREAITAHPNEPQHPERLSAARAVLEANAQVQSDTTVRTLNAPLTRITNAITDLTLGRSNSAANKALSEALTTYDSLTKTPPTTPEQRAALNAARDAVAVAQQNVQAERTALSPEPNRNVL